MTSTDRMPPMSAEEVTSSTALWMKRDWSETVTTLRSFGRSSFLIWKRGAPLCVFRYSASFMYARPVTSSCVSITGFHFALPASASACGAT